MTNYLTQQDVSDYGPELISFAQRAAYQVFEPQLQQLDTQNNELRWQLARETRARLDRQLEQEIPNFREIDRDPRWHAWLRGHDSISGRNRQELLNEAAAGGHLNRVLAIFRGFMAGHLDPGQPAAARARTAAARTPTANVYTRDQIRRLYEQHQKGKFAGREDEWNRIERDIVAAGREGRVVGAITDVAGK